MTCTTAYSTLQNAGHSNSDLDWPALPIAKHFGGFHSALVDLSPPGHMVCSALHFSKVYEKLEREVKPVTKEEELL